MKPECSLDAGSTTQAAACPRVSTSRQIAAWAWWGLLAGYLVFNKQFAVIGIPPVYVGEAVIAVALLVHGPRLFEIVSTPVKQSWAMRFILIFLLYGMIRAAIDLNAFGFMALRDSVICVYAIAAFLTPALWRDLILESSPASGVHHSTKSLVTHAVMIMRPISTAAALWATVFVTGVYAPDPWNSTKADLLAAAVAICAWLWLITALQWFFSRQNAARENAKRPLQIGAAVVLAGAAIFLLVNMRIRSAWIAGIPLAAAFAAAFAYTTRGKAVLAAATVVIAIVAGSALYSKTSTLFGGVDKEFALHANMANVVDAGPKEPPTPDLETVLTRNGMVSLSEAERTKAFNTVWRAIFWVRACRYTVHHAPLSGIGFGENLTNVLRGTSAWPLFVPSMQLNPPNRSPHNAHVTILTRLGIAGFALWIMILFCVSWETLKALWRLGSSQTAEARALFCNGLGLFGVWLIYLSVMSFGVVLEGPMGGIWFWSLTGVLACWSHSVCSEKDKSQEAPA